MCGRYVSPEEADLERYWGLTHHQATLFLSDYVQRFNVAPTTQIPIVFIENGAVVVKTARWGLIPVWWKQPKMPPFTFNTRSEEAADKPMWRTPLKSSRCLVPAMGWYEWKPVEAVDPNTGEIKTVKQPYFIHLPDKGLIHFAGLMSKRRDGEGYSLSASIMTRAAVGAATQVHDRMPVILAPDAFEAWMDPSEVDSERALALAEDKAVTGVEFYRVSTRVSSSRNEGAELLEPFPNPA